MYQDSAACVSGFSCLCVRVSCLCVRIACRWIRYTGIVIASDGGAAVHQTLNDTSVTLILPPPPFPSPLPPAPSPPPPQPWGVDSRGRRRGGQDRWGRKGRCGTTESDLRFVVWICNNEWYSIFVVIIPFRVKFRSITARTRAQDTD